MPEQHRTKDILIGVMTIAMIVVGVTFYVYKNLRTTSQTASSTVAQEPQKTDFGTSVSSDFPTDIPIEEGVQVDQSYGLNYVEQKQLTIVFLSTKTVEDNYALYADFLEKQNWNVVNKYESTKLSSFYATKESNDINVTISGNSLATSTKSQVSISVLKKL